MNYILKVQCRDEKGLISRVTNALFERGFNIVEMKEHVDRDDNNFFMRCEFTGSAGIAGLSETLAKALPENAKVLVQERQKKSVVVFATKEYHCLSDLLIRNHFNELNADIKCVIANHEDLKGITEKFNIPFIHISHLNKSKAEFEAELIQAAQAHRPDYLVLAKFMRILSPNFVATFPGRIVNIHHSFLPAFIGANPYRQAFERGIKIIGATAHFVTDNLDEGPIITQKTLQVDHSYSADDMKKTGKEIERFALAEALEHVFEDRIFISGNKTVIFD